MRTGHGLRRAVIILSALVASSAWADDYADTIEVFRSALGGEFFDDSYGYAVFPKIGKGGIGIGGAHGKGRVYVGGEHSGDTKMTQVTVGFQLGGQVFSQIIFFQDKRAYSEFTGGNFEFGAQATAVALTAGASASASTTGAGVAASGDGENAKASGDCTRQPLADKSSAISPRSSSPRF